MKLKQIPRRAFLQSAGTLIALPFLEAMLPWKSRAFAAGLPKRFVTVYFPHGTTDNWDPIVNGANYQLRAFQTALEQYKPYISFLHKIDNNINTFHPGLVTGFLAAKTVPKSGAPFEAAKTMDQYIADVTQTETRLRDLIMSSDASSGGESGQSGVYGSNLSWLSPTTPATRYVSNSQIFNRLFPNGPTTTMPTTPPPPPPVNVRKSILDFSADSLSRLNAQLGAKDKQTVDQFLTSLREVEKKIAATPAAPPTQPPAQVQQCNVPANPGDPGVYSTDLDIKIDLMALAFQCDVTRVATLLLDPEPGVRNMGFIPGVSGQSHSISHWRDNAAIYGPMHEKVNAFYISKLARLLGKLMQIQDSTGNGLDNSIVLFGSSNKDSHNHVVKDLPLILAGKGGGSLTPGPVKVFAQGSTLAQVHLTIMKAMGVNIASYAGANTTLKL